MVRRLKGPAVRAISTYASKEGVRMSGMTRIGSSSTNGDRLGTFCMPRR